MNAPATVVQTECRECSVLVNWRATRPRPNALEFEPIDKPSSFVCPHWRDHHVASTEALEAADGTSQVGKVTGRVLTRD